MNFQTDQNTVESLYATFPDHIKQYLDAHKEELSQSAKDILSRGYYSKSLFNNSWSFTQGLLIGQFSVIFVFIVFIKFFVFAGDTSDTSSNSSIKDISGIITKRRKGKIFAGTEESNETNNEENLSEISTILEKTYYDVEKHTSESLDWFNVLVAQTISQLRREALLSNNIYHSLNEALTNTNLPEYVDKINLTEIDIGDDFPIFSNCRISHSKDGFGRLEAKIDVDLSDVLTLGIETRLLLNHPRPKTAILPVSMSVSLVRFSGCLTVSLINTNDQEFINVDSLKSSGNLSSNAKENFYNTDQSHINHKGNQSDGYSEPAGTALMFSFSPDYRLEFKVKSLIGSKAKLQDVPKISTLIESKLRSWFVERCIEPRYQVVKLPSIWPRSKNTREPIHTNVKKPDITEKNAN